MGGPKALLSFGDTTFLARVCCAFAEAGSAAVVVVLGAQADTVRSEARLPEGVIVLCNERWREGMLTSVWCGLDALEELRAEAVLLHPVDNPFVDAGTIRAVMAALAEGSRIAVPCHAGRRGHPAGFSHDVWPALRQAPLEIGARAVLAEHPDWIRHVPAGSDCLVDVDTPADLLGPPSRAGRSC